LISINTIANCIATAEVILVAPWCSNANTIALSVLAFCHHWLIVVYFKFLLVAFVVTASCMATANADAATLHDNAVGINPVTLAVVVACHWCYCLLGI